jgi:hypothetical protein
MRNVGEVIGYEFETKGEKVEFRVDFDQTFKLHLNYNVTTTKSGRTKYHLGCDLLV